MTPECKIRFPELGEYRVVFGPTVPGIPGYTIAIDGYPDPFVEYCPPLPTLRMADFDPVPKMYNAEWKPGYIPPPSPVFDLTAYSNCENYILEPDAWKSGCLLYAGELVCPLAFRVTEFTRSANPYPGVPYLYQYTFKMKIRA